MPTIRKRCLAAVLSLVATALAPSAAAQQPPSGEPPPLPTTAATEQPPPPPAPAAVCVPGAQVECACGGGVTGFQVCSDDGARFDACHCPAAPPQARPPAPWPPGPVALPPAYYPATPPGTLAVPPPAPVWRKQNKGLKIAGIVMTAVGGVGTVASALGLALSLIPQEECDALTCYERRDAQPANTFVVALPLSAAVLVGGVVMLAVGSRRSSAPEPPVEPRAALILGPRSGVRWTF